jgi:hypothetical protein
VLSENDDSHLSLKDSFTNENGRNFKLEQDIDLIYEMWTFTSARNYIETETDEVVQEIKSAFEPDNNYIAPHTRFKFCW